MGDRWMKNPFTGNWGNQYRGGIYLYLALTLIGILSILGINSIIILLLSAIWLIFTLYFTFPLGGYGYFEKYPVQWEEMDELQKWQYGLFVRSGDSTVYLKLTQEQYNEWEELNKKFKTKFKLK